MRDVASAVPGVGMNLVDPLLWYGRLSDHIRPDGREFPEDPPGVLPSADKAVVRVFRGHRHHLCRQATSLRPQSALFILPRRKTVGKWTNGRPFHLHRFVIKYSKFRV